MRNNITYMSISEKRLEEIRNFKNMDFSDCPELTDEQLAQLKPCHIVNSKLWQPRKTVLNIRIDADVLEALKSAGKGWQTKVNAILRNAVATGQI